MNALTETLLRAALVDRMNEVHESSINRVKKCSSEEVLEIATIICLATEESNHKTSKANTLKDFVRQAHIEQEAEHDALKTEIKRMTES